MEWTGGKIEMLIEWYSQFPFLFDAKQADYHNKIKRSACLSCDEWRHLLNELSERLDVHAQKVAETLLVRAL